MEMGATTSSHHTHEDTYQVISEKPHVMGCLMKATFLLLVIVASIALTDAWMTSRSVCGHRTYDSSFYMCCGGNVVSKPFNPACCGTSAYDSHWKICCGGRIQNKPFNPACCGTQAFDSHWKMCCGKAKEITCRRLECSCCPCGCECQTMGYDAFTQPGTNFIWNTLVQAFRASIKLPIDSARRLPREANMAAFPSEVEEIHGLSALAALLR
ncbi:hypothetical protein LSAT2_008475 [Lamellibrachia satsuma]|nr:hypothetical protein LSAT2_008475 [Lamellibrachia satsuma]